MTAPWPAPRATAPVDAVVSVPGSKSVTNRALVLAALATEPSRVRTPLRARDTLLMAGALRALGVGIADDGADWLVTPGRLRGGGSVDVGLAGTVQRFVPPLAALADAPVRFDGDPRARHRPLAPLVEGLRQLGAEVDDVTLPLTVYGRGSVKGGTAEIDSTESSQFISGLLLAAPRYEEGLVLRHTGARPAPSALQIAMTTHMLADAGATVTASPDGREWTVAPGPLRGGELVVPPDLSSAAPFVVAAVATGGRVRIPGWPRRSDQPGGRLPELLRAMGASCVVDDDGLTTTAGTALLGLDADLADCTELVPALAALAALAGTESTFYGIAHMRGQETDRLRALSAELTRLGGECHETPDGLRVVPRPLHGGLVHTYEDHRMAMFAAVLGLAVDGVLVENVATTGKTVPDFVDRWTGMLGTAPAGAPH
ncbi:MAG TPA: 3-phosphoshikimate 1-carboxyvinyltransferase [Mycobacteriales bacterium]|nr:3-phosphoshikimate 1-carboxyvinyltransferase [Mycobacteriales bacterium]